MTLYPPPWKPLYSFLHKILPKHLIFLLLGLPRIILKVCAMASLTPIFAIWCQNMESTGTGFRLSLINTFTFSVESSKPLVLSTLASLIVGMSPILFVLPQSHQFQSPNPQTCCNFSAKKMKFNFMQFLSNIVRRWAFQNLHLPLNLFLVLLATLLMLNDLI